MKKEMSNVYAYDDAFGDAHDCVRYDASEYVWFCDDDEVLITMHRKRSRLSFANCYWEIVLHVDRFYDAKEKT